jgi:hypothetical protein
MPLHVNKKDVVSPIEYITHGAIKKRHSANFSFSSKDENDVSSKDKDENENVDKTSLTKKLILASVSTLLFLVLSKGNFSMGIIFFILFLSFLYFMK